MQGDDIRRAVRGFICEQFYIADESQLRDDRSLLDSGTVDSTGILEVIGFLERTFEIRVEDDEMVPANLDSVDGIVRFVEAKRRA